MELFFASDLHGSLPETQLVIEKFRESGAGTLVLLGDVLNHGPRNPVPEGYAPAEVATLLNQYADSIIAVRGNCDSEVDQMLLNFPMMTDYSWLLLESGQRMFITHGHLYNSTKRPPLKNNDLMAFGHTHIPLAEKEQGIILFNPGSVTFPREGHPASFGYYRNGELQVISFKGDVIAQCRCSD
ncbi:phosphodiesterase [Vibrio sp. ZSDE26]|uniref:Phosphoesterase n=1 Tax=Vibrio amylolyticus TaxID=2847292 RepID=A0A9X1XG42_9VIBR|nr:phosphodiesterase [Vibrio amylolyticus]